MIFHLSTRVPFLKPQFTPTKGSSLYPTFVVYFIDYRRPIFLIQRTIKFNKNNLYPISYGQNGICIPSIVPFFYKDKKTFSKKEINVKLFFRNLFYRKFYLVPHIFYMIAEHDIYGHDTFSPKDDNVYTFYLPLHNLIML